jgi:hypothetical protein
MEQNTFGLRHGVLYEADPRALIGIEPSHIDSQHPYNQAYGQYLMVTVHDEENPGKLEGRHFMLDTYLIDKTEYYAPTMDGRIEKISEIAYVSSWYFNRMAYSCYWRSVAELTESSAPLFTPICDLREMRQLTYREQGHFDPADCVGPVHLARELGFSWDFGDIGINLVRKDADTVAHLKADALAREMLRSGGLIPHDMSALSIRVFEEFVIEHRDDPKVLDVYEAWRDRITETLAFAETHRARRECPGQLALFDANSL